MIYEYNKDGGIFLIAPCTFWGVKYKNQYLLLWYRTHPGAKWLRGEEHVICFQPHEIIGMKKYKSLEVYLADNFEDFL